MSKLHTLNNLTNAKVKIYPLVVFRIIFGTLLFFSTLRFWLNGWIEGNYINPKFHFKYFGFEWIPFPTDNIIYLLFIICGVSSVLITLGLLYRLGAILFFLTFTYIELLDATFYLNHYYFVSLIAFILIFVPANKFCSLDVKFGLTNASLKVSSWTINIIKFQLIIVYFYAGLAKLNYDWLVEAMPLKIWLAPHTNIPFIGNYMDDNWVAYLFSYCGALFDLTIPFFLTARKTRKWAYLFVIIFHLLTAYLFPIGVFPYVMICSTIIFFGNNFHSKVLFINQAKESPKEIITKTHTLTRNVILMVFISFQLLFPFRYLLYTDDLFWTEQGYRFSWRVMLMEKAGYAQFKVYPYNDQRFILVNNSDYLTPIQEKMMSTQPDFIIQYAHMLGKQYEKFPNQKVKVTVDSYVSINGKGSKRYVKSEVDLMQINNSFKPINWLEEYEN